MAKLTKITEAKTEVTIDIAGEEIKAEVYLNRWTGEFVDNLREQADDQQGKFLARTACSVLASWDLEFDPEVNKDEAGNPLSGIIPLQPEMLHKHIPVTLLGEIMRKMHEASRPDPKPSTSFGSF